MRNLKRYPFTAPTLVSSHPLGVTPASSGLFTVTCSPLVQETVPTSAYPRHYPQPLLLGESYPCCHTVGTCSHERQQGLLRSSRSFCASVGPHSLPGLVGVNLGHTLTCPAPSLVLLDPANTPRRLVFPNESSTVCSLSAHRRLLPGMTPLESGRTRFSSRFTDARTSRTSGDDAFRSFTEGWELRPASNVKLRFSPLSSCYLSEKRIALMCGNRIRSGRYRRH